MKISSAIPYQCIGMLTLIGAVGGAGHAIGQELAVLSTLPLARINDAPRDAMITVNFDRSVDPATFLPGRSFWAYGKWSGVAAGSFVFTNGNQSVLLIPDQPFAAGETVTVILSHDLRGIDGSPLRAGGYSFQFWTRSRPVTLALTEIGRFSTRTTPGQTSRAYGGIAADLNGDRFSDITIVNEDTDDLRVFLNQATGAGTFSNFLNPTFGTGNVPSPSEPADFNHDGITDICVANTQGASVSILLGIGDGRFGPEQRIITANQPRGLAVLDADGDGDLDVVSSNFGGNNLTLFTNNGAGVFSMPVSFEAGVNGERALSAADMDEDGLLDLVVGAYSGQRVAVMRGVGNGTFASLGNRLCGGTPWMLGCGDLNGDRHEDVALVNASQDAGATMTGIGNGQLNAPAAQAVDGFPLATDLGDLDGDGDLDWVTSSFSGDWFVFTNDGAGAFTLFTEVLSTQAASCALLFDFDNDLDLDVAMIDELADEVILMKNTGAPTCPGDANDDGAIDLTDLAVLLSNFGSSGGALLTQGDVDADGDVDLTDLSQLLSGFGGAC